LYVNGDIDGEQVDRQGAVIIVMLMVLMAVTLHFGPEYSSPLFQ
jgi:hypothetical protein